MCLETQSRTLCLQVWSSVSSGDSAGAAFLVEVSLNHSTSQSTGLLPWKLQPALSSLLQPITPCRLHLPGHLLPGPSMVSVLRQVHASLLELQETGARPSLGQALTMTISKTYWFCSLSHSERMSCNGNRLL